MLIKTYGFFDFGRFPSQTPPKSKMLIFHYTYAKFTSKKSVFDDFRGGLGGSKSNFGTTLFSKTPLRRFLWFFDAFHEW